MLEVDAAVHLADEELRFLPSRVPNVSQSKAHAKAGPQPQRMYNHWELGEGSDGIAAWSLGVFGFELSLKDRVGVEVCPIMLIRSCSSSRRWDSFPLSPFCRTLHSCAVRDTLMEICSSSTQSSVANRHSITARRQQRSAVLFSQSHPYEAMPSPLFPLKVSRQLYSDRKISCRGDSAMDSVY